MPSDARALPLETLADAEAVAARGAAHVAAELKAAVAARGRATLAISGGRTPLRLFALLARVELPWQAIHVVQVDERFTPPGHEDRNAVQLARAFGAVTARWPEAFHWMPVDDADAPTAARRYAQTLANLAGSPPVLDVVQLGLGADGHTASLFPGTALDAVTPTVGLTPSPTSWPRMTLLWPVLNAARSIVWLVTGRDKRAALAGLMAADAAVVGSGVRRTGALVLADRDAAAAAV
jgi:6-phosphogluconolactonase